MAGGYVIDPATGMPAVPMSSGGMLPLALSPADMQMAGAQLQGPPGLPPSPPAGPDLRVAGPGGGPTDLGGAPDPSVFGAEDAQARQARAANAFRQQLTPPGAPTNEHAAAPGAGQPAWMPTGQGVPGAPGARPAANAAELAQHRPAPGQGGAVDQGGLDNMDPATRQVFIESLRGGAGGGPRKLGETGESRKYVDYASPMNPELAGRANEALGASDKYNEELAKSVNFRQQQAYEAQQAEFADRSGQLAAQQQRFAAQQSALQDYQGKRDALMQEAAQMKTPQMEDYWGSRTDMAKMATALSITLGGALQGLRGGQNPGLEMSNQAIDRWIVGQKEAYQRAKGRVDDADNQYAKMVQAFGNENLAEGHLREQAWTVRDGMLQSYAQKVGTPSALEAYNQAMLQTEAQRAALQAQNSRGAQVEIDQKLSMQGGAGGSSTLLSALEKAARGKKAIDTISGADAKPKGGREELKDVNDLESSLAPTKQLLSRYKAADDIPGIGGRNVVSRGVRGAADFIAGEGAGSQALDTPEERANRQVVNDLRAGIKHAITGAGMSQTEAATLDELIVGARTKQDLENVVRTAETKIAAHRRLIAGGASSAQPDEAAPSEELVQ